MPTTRTIAMRTRAHGRHHRRSSDPALVAQRRVFAELKRDFSLAPAKVLCPRCRIVLIISVIPAFRSAVPIVAVGMGKQHDGDLLHRSRDNPRRCLVRTTVKQIQHEKHVKMRDRDLE
ncbi:hypothetical protein EDB85DRAFT_2272138, partial [Lactarius pseudohatsudake]